jgi:hypothetical protein
VTFSSGRPVSWTGELLQRRSSTFSCVLAAQRPGQDEYLVDIVGIAGDSIAGHERQWFDALARSRFFGSSEYDPQTLIAEVHNS